MSTIRASTCVYILAWYHEGHSVYQEHQRSHSAQPLVPHEVPQRPCEATGTDIFIIDGVDYLLVANFQLLFKRPTRLTKMGIHGLQSNKPKHANWPFWQMDLVNWPNSCLASHDLQSSALLSKEQLVIWCPCYTANSWASPSIKPQSDHDKAVSH